MNALFIKKIDQQFFIHIIIGSPVITKISKAGTNTFVGIK